MTQDELNEKLDSHERWLKDPASGERAVLDKRDLSGLDLSGRDLSGIVLINAVLVKASLEWAILACESNALILRDADVREANLRGAKLGDEFRSVVNQMFAYYADAFGIPRRSPRTNAAHAQTGRRKPYKTCVLLTGSS